MAFHRPGRRRGQAIGDRIETRRKVLAPDAAVGALQAHTLAVNDVGVAFVRAARERGDECGPFAWRNEITHPFGPPPGRGRAEQLISDAVLRYQHDTAGQPRFLYRFVEVDRATRATDDLAERIARYGRLHRHTIPGPAGRQVRLWPKLYPTFPRRAARARRPPARPDPIPTARVRHVRSRRVVGGFAGKRWSAPAAPRR